MQVSVKLHGLLRPHHPGPNRSSPLLVEMPASATPRDIARTLNLPEALARMVFINDVQATLDDPLKDGDRLGFFSVVVGG